MDTSFDRSPSVVESRSAAWHEVRLVLADENDPLATVASALAARAGAYLVTHMEALDKDGPRAGHVRPDLKQAALSQSALANPEALEQARAEWELELSCEEADWRAAFPRDPKMWATGLAKFAELHFDKHFRGMGVESYYRTAKNTAKEMLPEAVADSRAMLFDLWQAGRMSLPEIVQLSGRLTNDLATEVKDLEAQRKRCQAKGDEVREVLDQMQPTLAKLGGWARRFGTAGRHLRQAVKRLSELYSARTSEEHVTTMRDVLGELMRSAWQTASDTRKLLATLQRASELCRLDWEKKARQAVPRLLRSNRADAWNVHYQGLHLLVAKAVLGARTESFGQGWSALLAMDVTAWQRALLSQAQRVMSENPPPLAVRKSGDVDWADLIGNSVVELGLDESSPIPLQVEVRASSSIPMLAEVLDEAEERAESLSHRLLSLSLVPQSEITPLITVRFSDASVEGMESDWQTLASAALTTSFQFNRIKTAS